MAGHQATGLWRVGVLVVWGLYNLFWLLWVCVRKVRWEHHTKAAAFHFIFEQKWLAVHGQKTLAVFHLQRAQPLNENSASLNRNVGIILFENEAGSRSKFKSIALRKGIKVNTIFGSTLYNSKPLKFIKFFFFFFCVDFTVVALSHSTST